MTVFRAAQLHLEHGNFVKPLYCHFLGLKYMQYSVISIDCFVQVQIMFSNAPCKCQLSSLLCGTTKSTGNVLGPTGSNIPFSTVPGERPPPSVHWVNGFLPTGTQLWVHILYILFVHNFFRHEWSSSYLKAGLRSKSSAFFSQTFLIKYLSAVGNIYRSYRDEICLPRSQDIDV